MNAAAKALLAGPVDVIHAGLDSVADAPRAAGASVTTVDFLPPAGGDPHRIAQLDRLLAPPLAPAIDEANARALARLLASRPHLVGVGIARDVVPGMTDRLFLHAGPPIEWDRMCGPMRGAVVGGILFEGMAGDPEEAARLASGGAIDFSPCHHHCAVGPMAGLVTPSMPVWILEDRDGPGKGNRTFCTLNEGLGKVLRYGAYADEVIGRLRFMADDAQDAERLAESGAVSFSPCHHHHAVGPMAGLITPSMPVWILEDQDGAGKGNRTFCTLNEGLGKVLRYGAYSEGVIVRLRFIAAELAPVLSAALVANGPIDVRMLMAQALHMGDEGHNRNRAATSLLLRQLSAAIVRTAGREEAARAIEFITGNDHFFLNLSMPMAKCMLLAAEGERLSSMVTVMARNGTDFGIQVSSMPGCWFVGPAQMVRGLYFPGFSAADANPDSGDSAITETCGFGGFAMAAAPAIVQFVGGDAADALATTGAMHRITVGANDGWTIPAMGFAGTPTGIDIRRVEELNLLPTINTGIAHRTPGIGQVGAGLVNPPWECVHAALAALAESIL